MSYMNRLNFHIESMASDDKETETMKTHIFECIDGKRHWKTLTRKEQDTLASWEAEEKVNLVNWSEFPDHEPVTHTKTQKDGESCP